MAARITINMNAKGELEIWLNPEGRDAFVKELQALSETSDHFHLGPRPIGEVEVSSVPYRSDDTLLEWGKVLFRTDKSDAEYYPHVMPSSTTS